VNQDFKKLREVCQIKPPKKEAKEKLSQTDLVSFLPMSDLGTRTKKIQINEVKPLGEVVGSYTYFAENDVLLAKITPCFENGKLGIARNLVNGVGFGSSEYIVLRSKGEIDPDYLFYFLARDTFRENGSRVMTGAVGHKRIPKGFIEEYPIPIQPMPEQKRIVAILDEVFEGVDRAIANTEKNLTNTHELFQSYLNAIFRQGDSFPSVRIGDIGEVFDGPHATPKTIDYGPIFLGISSLQDGIIRLEKTRHVSPEDFKKWTRRVEPRADDIVFSYETRLGQAAIIPEELKCCLGRRMGLVRFDKTKVEPRYFLYLYLSPPYRKFLDEKTIRGATVDRISIKEFPAFPISLPDMEEQKQMVYKIESFSRQIQHLQGIYQRKLEALAELKQSILQKAFSGELTADTVMKEVEGAILA